MPSRINPTLLQLGQVVPTLTRQELLAVSREHLDLSGYVANALTIAQQLRLYLYEWLKHWNMLDTRSIDHLIRAVDPWLEHVGRASEQDVPGRLTSLFTCPLTLIEWRYAVWPEQPEWYDCVMAEQVKAPGQTLAELRPVTYVVCDVLALYRQKQRWLDKLIGEKA